MSRYRKIEVKTWTDERFLALSALLPSGQALWFYLLSGVKTGMVPGLFQAGPAAMAEDLNWELEAFRKAFQEILDQGMAEYDQKARLVYLPNALRHNKPANPNVIIGWRVELELLPACDLKTKALEAMRQHIADECEASYLIAFERIITPASKAVKKASEKNSPKATAKASAKTSVEPSRKQEQKQEQKQSQEKVNTLVELSPDQGEKKVDPVPEIFAYWQKIMELPGSKLDANRITLIRKALKSYTPAEVCMAIRGCRRSPHHMGQNDRQTLYNGLSLILRNAEYIEKFIVLGRDDKEPVSPGKESVEQATARVLRELAVMDAQEGAPADDGNTIDMEQGHA